MYDFIYVKFYKNSNRKQISGFPVMKVGGGKERRGGGLQKVTR